MITDEQKAKVFYNCPICDGLMDTPPNDYHICPHCMTEFGTADEPNYPAEPYIAHKKSSK